MAQTTPTYISKIAVAYGAKESTPKDILTNNGFTVIDYDLNKGCGSLSDYIYMGYKTTQNPSEAITGIFFRIGENPPASATFDGVTAYLLGGSGESNPGENTYVDLNEDAGGSYIYTYVTRDASRAAVLQGLHFNSSNSASGYVTPNVNLNSGTSGGAIYLHYQQFSGKASATFNYLNANGSRTSSSTSVSVKHHQQAVNNTPSAPSSVSYDGRTFTLLGWREDNTATTAGSTPSYTYMDSKVYRAVYSADVSLTYNANGGSGAPSTQNAIQYINASSSSIAKSNASITIPATIPTHDATKCNFSGWSTSSSATTAQYQPGNNISINTNTTLYAVWLEHNGTKTSYVNIGETHTYTWSCCGKSATEDHIYDNGIDHYCGAHIHEIDENGYCDLCDGYPATLVDGYYQINNANELLWFAEYVNSIDKTASAKLMNDIEMNAVQWTPIGTDAAYNGTFDGQGYTINNLWHNTGVADGGREGLFTLIGSDGVVKNIVLNNATIWGGSSYGFNSCGGIAIKNQGTISNCIIAGSTIQFGNYAHFGGIAGHNTGTIKNCAVRNSILRRRWGGVDNRNIGGITQTNNGTVTDCYSYDNIYEYGLTTCAISAEGNAPINSYQYTTSTVADAAETAKTKAQFASGDVAYLLQGEQATQVWGQNIDNEEAVQAYPVISDAKVYKYTFGDVTLYSNHETLGKCGDNLFWYVEDNVLTIYGTGAMYDYNNYDNISTWRNLSPKPTSLVLEEGITHIGNYAFYQCSGFTGSLTTPNSVTTIGNYAFYQCSGFTGSLTIPNSVTTIGNSAFSSCSGFNGSLTIPNSVTTIGNSAFSGCKGFTGSLTIPNSVTTIGNFAFSSCSGFNGSLTIPNSITTIGNSAFRNCSGFNGSLTIPNSVTTIGDYVFAYCSGFNGSLTIPNSVTTIGESAFRNCSGFNGTLTIPNSVTTIGNSAFSSCSGFTEVYSYAETAPTLGTSAFTNIGKNATLYYPVSGEQSYDNQGWFNYFSKRIGLGQCGDNLYWYVDNNNTLTIFGTGAMYDYEWSELDGDISPWRNLNTAPTSLVLEEGITHIGNYAFRYCDGFIGSLTIPNSVTSIGYEAFYSCSGFTGSLTIGNSVTTIGDKAFDECSGFTGSLTIPNSVTSIGYKAFCSCSGFTGSLTIGNSVTTIGNYAFQNCSGFTGSLTIPNSVTTIGDNAFDECSGFTGSLTIPNSVTSIGKSVFAYCSGFTGSLTIPNSVTTIGTSAFAYCSGFTGSLTIPNSVTTIGNSAFENCSGFTGSLTIPNSVTTIENYAFYECTGFNSSLTIGNSVTYIGDYAFRYCSGFRDIFFYRDTNPTIGSYIFSYVYSAKIYAPVIWNSYDNIPSNQLVKMATFVGQQTTDASTGSATVNGWVFPEGMTEVGENDHVAINAPLVLGSQQDNKTTRQQGSTANSLSVKSFGYCGNGTTVNGSITIEDGGQLYCEVARGEVTVKKEIIGYAGQQSTDNSQQTVWYTIASPLKDTLLISDPQFLNSSVPQFLSSNSDLYRYDEPSYTWQNAKNSANNGFNTIDPGRGYLYANANDTVLEFTGMINTDEVTYNLTTDGNVLTGFHLVGNPFTHNITFAHLNATEGAELVNGYYVLNGEGAWGATLGNNEDDVIKVGQGALIKAKTAGTLAIAKSQSRKDAESQSRGQQSTDNRQQTLGITVSNAQHSDRAFVVFDKGVGLDKINHENENIPLLYIPMDDADYAIAMMDINVNEIPVNFETNVMGQYTISLRQDNCEFDELYLLDKQTDEKVNILENDYTFIATSNDAPERFVLLKDNGQQSTDNSHFAYINNGDIVIYDINGNADIKIFDAMGRCLYKGNSSDETARIANDFSAGVYVIQKADDNGVKVQKIILG